MAAEDYFDPQSRRRVAGPVNKRVSGGASAALTQHLAGAMTGYTPYKDYKDEITKKGLTDVAFLLRHTKEYILMARTGAEEPSDSPKIHFYEARRREDPLTIDWIVTPQYIDSFTRFSSLHRQEADTLYNYYGGQYAIKGMVGFVNDGFSGLWGGIQSGKKDRNKSWDIARSDPNFWMAVIGGFAGGGAAAGVRTATKVPVNKVQIKPVRTENSPLQNSETAVPNFKKSSWLPPSAKPQGITYDGRIYRYEVKDPERLESTWKAHEWNVASNHRYTKPGNGGVYAGTTQATAKAEISHYGAFEGRTLVTKDIKQSNILDLRKNTVRKKLGISRGDLINTSHNYQLTHDIGNWAKQEGYSGLLVPSARDKGGANIILFDGL